MFLSQTELIGVTDESMPCLEAPACKLPKMARTVARGGPIRLKGIVVASLNSPVS